MDLKEEYKKEKCLICKNKNKKIEEDLCEIKQFSDNQYIYCKCCNMTEKNNELKRKIM